MSSLPTTVYSAGSGTAGTVLLALAVSLGLLAPPASAQQQPTTHAVKLLTPDTALKSAQAALSHCRQAGYQAAVAVVTTLVEAPVVPKEVVDRLLGQQDPLAQGDYLY